MRRGGGGLQKTSEEWRGLFWLTAGILWGGALFFCIFARGSVESWAESPTLGTEMTTPPSAMPLIQGPDPDDLKPAKA